MPNPDLSTQEEERGEAWREDDVVLDHYRSRRRRRLVSVGAI